MANQFIQYPIVIQKLTNGYLVYTLGTSPMNEPSYVFANQADLTYWLGLNESPPA